MVDIYYRRKQAKSRLILVLRDLRGIVEVSYNLRGPCFPNVPENRYNKLTLYTGESRVSTIYYFPFG